VSHFRLGRLQVEGLGVSFLRLSVLCWFLGDGTLGRFVAPLAARVPFVPFMSPFGSWGVDGPFGQTVEDLCWWTWTSQLMDRTAGGIVSGRRSCVRFLGTVAWSVDAAIRLGEEDCGGELMSGLQPDGFKA
jgi:hypothetical protein